MSAGRILQPGAPLVALPALCLVLRARASAIALTNTGSALVPLTSHKFGNAYAAWGRLAG